MEEYINKIINDDCFNILPKIKDESIDLILIDPPYGLGFNFENENLSKKEKDIFIEKYCKEIKRIIKQNGNIVIFCSQELGNDLYFKLLNLGLFYQNEIIWVRPTGHNITKKLAMYHEKILTFTKQKHHTTFNLDIIRIKSIYAEKDKRLNPKGKNPGDVWSINNLLGKKNERIMNENNQALHPTQKPIEIINKLIMLYSNENDLILDFFSGTGTTAIVCIDNKRNFICIEKDKDYYKSSINRINDYQEKKNINGIKYRIIGK